MATVVVSKLGAAQDVRAQTFACTQVFNQGTHLGVALLGHVVSVFNLSGKALTDFTPGSHRRHHHHHRHHDFCLHL